MTPGKRFLNLSLLLIFAVAGLMAASRPRQQSSPDSQNPAAQSSQPQKQRPVLIELFTSEGCSDCPPADNILTALAHRPPQDVTIIPLAFHVTYWDHLGWQDRFSAERYTERQQQYRDLLRVENIYTPQTVIDGRYETVGNNGSKVLTLIRRAVDAPKPVALELSSNGDTISISATGANSSAKVLLAITEDDLTTEVKAGENRSRTLHEDAVVRSLESVGKLKDGAFSRTVALKLKPEWQRSKLHAVAFVQDNNGHVLGAAETSIASATAAVR